MEHENLEQRLEESVEKLHEMFEHTDLDTEWKKIQKKMEEAHYNPGAVRPIVDSMLSLFLAGKSRGYDVHSVLCELEKVAAESVKADWKKMPDGTYQSF